MRLVVYLSLFVLLFQGCSGDNVEGAECDPGADDFVCQVFLLVNSERGNAGVSQMEWDVQLATAAQRHAVDMNDNGYFDHQSQDGRSFSDRVGETDFSGFATGENIALGQTTPEQVMNSWMNSPGHRSNILSDGSSLLGVGFENNHWVQVFGR